MGEKKKKESFGAGINGFLNPLFRGKYSLQLNQEEKMIKIKKERNFKGLFNYNKSSKKRK